VRVINSRPCGLPADFDGERLVRFGFERQRPERPPDLRAGPGFGHGVDQVSGLAGLYRFAQISLRSGHEAGHEGEQIQVIFAVTVGGVLVERDQGRGFQQQLRLSPQRVDLVPVRDEKGLDVAAMAAQGYVVAVRVGERGGAFDVVGDFLAG
jgi:hypothetical protein